MSKKTNQAYRNLTTLEALESRQLFSSILTLPVVAPPANSPAHAIQAAAAKPKVQAVQSTTGTGLTGEYFSDSNFQTAYMLRGDATVNLAPSQKADAAVKRSNSVRWTGFLSPTYTENYSFSVIASGGVRLWVDGQLLIDQAQSTGGNLRGPLNIPLVAGRQYAVTLEYTRRNAAGTQVKLEWSSLHQKLGTIPQKAMFPDTTVSLPATASGLIGQYYIGKNFQKLVMQRVDPGINFNFKGATPTPLIPGGSGFSIRWTGQITAAYSETYTFKAITDDGARLYVDDQLLINDFTVHSVKTDAAQITLVAGKTYDIRMDYFENGGVAQAHLLWSSPSQTLQVIPASVLSSTPAASGGTLTTTVLGAGSLLLSWTGSSSATGYIIQQSIDGGINYVAIATTAATVTQYEVDGLNPASSYMFRIVPAGSTDTSTPSNPTNSVTATTSPTNVVATPSSATTANLSWNNVSGNNGYAIFQSQNAASQTQSASIISRSLVTTDTSQVVGNQIGTVGADVTNYTVSGLSPATAYQFIVRSLNTTGVLSGLSNIASATTPPLAPASLTNGILTTSSIFLTWQDVGGETGYAIDRSLNGLNNWNQIGTTTAGVTNYTDTNLDPGSAFYYRVRSLNTGGTSAPSNAIQAVTNLLPPGAVASIGTSATGTTLNWADIVGETGFAILESTDGGRTFSQIGITPQGITTFPVTSLTGGSNYQFEVEAINAAGNYSNPSSPISILTVTSAPAALIATALSTSAATLSWTDVPGESGFTVERSPDGVAGWATVATLPAATLNYTDSTLTPGTTYVYRVRANNLTGTSAPSILATTLTIPAAPVAALAGLSVAQSQVSWNAVTGASQYVVQRSLNGSTNWTTVSTTNGSATSAVVPNLAASTAYFYRVQAVNASGSSAQSTVVSQVTAPLSQYAIHNVVYGTTAAGAIYAVNLANATSTWIGTLPVMPHSAVRDPISGVMYFYQSGTSNIYVWDPTTGNTNEVDTSFIPSPTASGAYLPDGTSYIVGTNGILYKGASGTLSVTTVGPLTLAGSAFTAHPDSMSFSPAGLLFMTVGANVYTVNTTTAAVTPVASVISGTVLGVFGPKGLYYTTTGTGSLYNVDLTSLLSTLLGGANTLPSFNSLAADAVFTHIGITATASPTTFTKGAINSYNLQITNTTGDATLQPITVTTTLQTGVTFASVAGTGWTASANGQVVTMIYSNGVTAGGALPTCTLNVQIATSASSIITTTFTPVSSDLDDTAIPAFSTVVTVAN